MQLGEEGRRGREECAAACHAHQINEPSEVLLDVLRGEPPHEVERAVQLSFRLRRGGREGVLSDHRENLVSVQNKGV
jgi:hypothetical protein